MTYVWPVDIRTPNMSTGVQDAESCGHSRLGRLCDSVLVLRRRQIHQEICNDEGAVFTYKRGIFDYLAVELSCNDFIITKLIVH